MLIRTIVRSVLVIVASTVVFGLAYPAVMVGFAQAAFPAQANGSLLYRDGHVVGSKLAAQDFTGPQYFHERPSATSPAYNAASTTFANYGPTSPELAAQVHENAEAILKLEGPYNPGLTISDIPVDAVTTSGSGIDPDISLAYAQLQARRVAAVRHLPLASVEKLISEYTTGRSLGVFGEPGVNVLELNLALDNLGDK
jgi:potassium-transporting ATPase KdpC subunit